jgi:hypothetical protein
MAFDGLCEWETEQGQASPQIKTAHVSAQAGFRTKQDEA